MYERVELNRRLALELIAVDCRRYMYMYMYIDTCIYMHIYLYVKHAKRFARQNHRQRLNRSDGENYCRGAEPKLSSWLRVSLSISRFYFCSTANIIKRRILCVELVGIRAI